MSMIMIICVNIQYLMKALSILMVILQPNVKILMCINIVSNDNESYYYYIVLLFYSIQTVDYTVIFLPIVSVYSTIHTDEWLIRYVLLLITLLIHSCSVNLRPPYILFITYLLTDIIVRYHIWRDYLYWYVYIHSHFDDLTLYLILPVDVPLWYSYSCWYGIRYSS